MDWEGFEMLPFPQADTGLRLVILKGSFKTSAKLLTGRRNGWSLASQTKTNKSNGRISL
jgi:hypothetical protein